MADAEEGAMVGRGPAGIVGRGGHGGSKRLTLGAGGGRAGRARAGIAKGRGGRELWDAVPGSEGTLRTALRVRERAGGAAARGCRAAPRGTARSGA